VAAFFVGGGWWGWTTPRAHAPARRRARQLGPRPYPLRLLPRPARVVCARCAHPVRRAGDRFLPPFHPPTTHTTTSHLLTRSLTLPNACLPPPKPTTGPIGVNVQPQGKNDGRWEGGTRRGRERGLARPPQPRRMPARGIRTRAHAIPHSFISPFLLPRTTKPTGVNFQGEFLRVWASQMRAGDGARRGKRGLLGNPATSPARPLCFFPRARTSAPSFLLRSPPLPPLSPGPRSCADAEERPTTEEAKRKSNNLTPSIISPISPHLPIPISRPTAGGLGIAPVGVNYQPQGYLYVCCLCVRVTMRAVGSARARRKKPADNSPAPR
jgi:hypothetical protein